MFLYPSGGDGGGNSSSVAPNTPKSFDRRDKLLALEDNAQRFWEETKVFESNREPQKEKYFVTFPFPYMNGKLHLGHAYSMSKAEFMAQFQRLKGRNVMWPFSFHLTGMPIQAAANRLKAEIAEFGGCPVDASKNDMQQEEEQNEAQLQPKDDTQQQRAEISGEKKFKGKKAKLVAKTGAKSQWEILRMMVPESEIPEFSDPMKWLNYFPPLGKADIKSFGCGVDWRRSFITTSVNPYFDSFVRWQFNTLKKANLVRFGKRANIFSPIDGQVCADHDRASGEGVVPQEYTLIKLRVKDISQHSVLSPLERRNVFLAPATLRPETMYGQTNCFVLPEGTYGAYEVSGGDVLIISERSARGLSFQGVAADGTEWGQVKCLVGGIKGHELLGLPLSAPLAQYDTVYTLPLLTISMGKGTGVVTSVPSDAPDDYVALQELQEKPVFRAKFNLTDDMVLPFKPVPIIQIPGFGNISAKVVCEQLKIKSCKEADKLTQAKEIVYNKGFYEGTMDIGPHKGKKVCDAKPLIRSEMIESGDALPYLEPESLVISRSGEECVVAFTDQWYLPYGEERWRGLVLEHINNPEKFNTYIPQNLDRFNFVLGWLGEWACTRLFGLGTKLPWDEQWVIESLSDSTIYQAYYTIAHVIHGIDNMDGTSPCSRLDPSIFTDDVWDYIFLLRNNLPVTDGKHIPDGILDEMRNEFSYWYPFDLRCSGKDLIQNHLTMSLYNHAAIWENLPHLWPRSFWCNGHILVNGEKMSKQRGNFLMLGDTIRRYSADAVRLALANAGDSLDDANFEEKQADSAIILLTKELDWIKSLLKEIENGELRDGPLETFMDKAFDNEMNRAIVRTEGCYSRMMWRDGIQASLFEFQLLRDFYREWRVKSGNPFHAKLVLRFVELQTIFLAPICPHWSENVWRNVLGRSGSVLHGTWPTPGSVDVGLTQSFAFLQKTIKTFRAIIGKLKFSSAGKIAQVLIAKEFEPWKTNVLLHMQHLAEEEGGARMPKDFSKRLNDYAKKNGLNKKEQQLTMQFGSFMKAKFDSAGMIALNTTLFFDQKAILNENRAFLTAILDLKDLEIFELGSSNCLPLDAKIVANLTPGQPLLIIPR